MTDALKVRIICSNCQGTGLADSVGGDGEPLKVPCLSCGQTGLLESGQVDGAETLDWIVKKIKKILHKLEIAED